MLKKDLFDFLDKSLEGLSVEQKEKTINRIVSKNYLQEYRKKITKGMKRCPLCDKYYSSKLKLETDFRKEIREECTYRDAGYGDDDRYGTVEYIVKYNKCPKCKKFFEVKKYMNKILSEKDRYGNVYK